MTYTRVIFEELPARLHRSSKKTKSEKIAEQLRSRPGEWARIGTSKNRASIGSTAHQISRAKLRAYAPAGSFEAAMRTVNGEHCLYARYVGAGGDPE